MFHFLSFKYHSHSPFFFPVHSPEEDLVLIEPWRAFKVLDPGIQRPEERTSIVPLEMEESDLIYEDEIVPNVSSHAARTMRDGIGDVDVVRRMLMILTSHPFDTKRIQHTIIQSILKHFFHRRYQGYIQGMRRDRVPSALP